MAAKARLGALFGGASAPLSHVGMASRSIQFFSRFFHSGSWRKLNTVAFKPLECHLLQGQKGWMGFRSFLIDNLKPYEVLINNDCLQILRLKVVKIVLMDVE